MYYLGIDGGGSKTKFTITDENLKVLGSIEIGTTHFKQIGFDGLEKRLSEGRELILDKCDLKKEELSGVGIGLAGYGNVKEYRDNIDKVCSKVFEGLKYIVFSDIRAAFSGALNDEDGIVIIAGTGSIGLALFKDEFYRSGGWGSLIGDEGSAYYIGLRTLNEFTKEADGRKEKGYIYNLIKDKLNLENDYNLLRYLIDEIKEDRREIAKFSKVCYEAALKGDERAMDIFIEAGIELSNIINGLSRYIKKSEIKVSYIGGVFKSGEYIINPLLGNLDFEFKLQEPMYTPDIGACILAIKKLK